MEQPQALPLLRLLRPALVLVAIAMACVALWLAFDNPTIRGTSSGAYPCLAPWDTALNDASNFPRGEPPRDGDVIDARCTKAGEDRFFTAVAFGVAAGGLLVLAAVVGATARRRAPRRLTRTG